MARKWWHKLVFAGLGLAMAACRPGTPSEYIQPDDMEDILVDYHLARAMAQNTGLHYDSIGYYQALYVDALLGRPVPDYFKDLALGGSDVSLAICSLGSNPEGAADFISFVISPEGQKICLENMKAIPVISSDLIDSDQKELVASLGSYDFVSIGALWNDYLYPAWQEAILPLG